MPSLKVSRRDDHLTVIVPELPLNISEQGSLRFQQQALGQFIEANQIENYASWYYTPMARYFTRELRPSVVVYDCMDELSGFRGAPPGLAHAESELLSAADLVFTGGQSLYESKKNRHPSVHLFPSSIDRAHFARARHAKVDPADQDAIPHPRLGYCGVIDERMDLDLLAEAAGLHPEWQFVLVGPVVKISEADLPRCNNIHFLGSKKYSELPAYLSGWDVALLPFARNDSTRFISPTKTPEYLAAGVPTISTPITDVVRPYGELGLVAIAEDAAQLVNAAEGFLARDMSQEEEWLRRVDAFLAHSSWDQTFSGMRKLILEAASQVRTAKLVGVAGQVPVQHNTDRPTKGVQLNV